jgi:hypothetical protein
LEQAGEFFEVHRPSPQGRLGGDLRFNNVSDIHNLQEFVLTVVQQICERASKSIDILDHDRASARSALNQSSKL